MTRLQRTLLALAATTAIALAGCGGDDDQGTTTGAGPTLDPGLDEASPESPPEEAGDADAGGGELADVDEAAVDAAVESYVTALNEGRGDLVCALIAPDAVDLSELPSEGGDCGEAVTASIGHRGKGGTPAWRKTTIREVKTVSVDGDTARVTATVTHDFAYRSYVSVEEDVIYLEKDGYTWLIAKPSGTFYRAVGYPEPPLESLSPP